MDWLIVVTEGEGLCVPFRFLFVCSVCLPVEGKFVLFFVEMLPRWLMVLTAEPWRGGPLSCPVFCHMRPWQAPCGRECGCQRSLPLAMSLSSCCWWYANLEQRVFGKQIRSHG